MRADPFHSSSEPFHIEYKLIHNLVFCLLSGESRGRSLAQGKGKESSHHSRKIRYTWMVGRAGGKVSYHQPRGEGGASKEVREGHLFTELEHV